MFREQVAEHYRQKGYRLHENVKIRGHSGAVHACDLVAQGPLGNLIIAFEDAGGLEGPELGAVKRAAKDVGATAVVAAERPPHGLRQIAARTGVVLLDEEAMRRPDGPTVDSSDRCVTAALPHLKQRQGAGLVYTYTVETL